MYYPQAWIDELMQKVDFHALVQDYTHLTKSSHASYKGLCPFHAEKSPSFTINVDLNLYHCFGCKAGGSIINFVMEMERLTYPEALEFLANRFQMPLPVAAATEEDRIYHTLKERLYQANEAAARYFHKTLWTPKGEACLSYLRRRGLDDQTIRRFGLGASTDGWQDLADDLMAQGFTLDELIKAGLVVQKDKHYYDMFRERVMYPIINVSGKVLAFGGRVLKDVQPKYLNTSDTPVFNKHRGVYAANLLRQEKKLGRVLLVEGYMDVIALRRHGIEGVVAALGTGLTEEQAGLIKRYAPEVWLAYDGDEPGQKAIERAIPICRKCGLTVKVLMFSAGEDPDETIARVGREGFLALKPITYVQFGLERIKKAADLSDVEGRTRFGILCCEMLVRHVSDPMERELYIPLIMEYSGFSRETVMKQLAACEGRVKPLMDKQEKQVLSRRPVKPDIQSEHQAEETLLLLAATGGIAPSLLEDELFSTERLKNVAHMLRDGVSPARIVTLMPDEDDRNEVAQIFAKEMYLEKEQSIKAAQDCLNILKTRAIHAGIADLRRRLNTLSGEERNRTLMEIMRLTNVLAGKKGLGD